MPKKQNRTMPYLLSLEIENIKCFGEKQILSFSNDGKHHAPWTIILGNNGTGKTTLLELIAGFCNIESIFDVDYPPLYHLSNKYVSFIPKESSGKINIAIERFKETLTRLEIDNGGTIHQKFKNMNEYEYYCFPYSSLRRIGEVKLASTYESLLEIFFDEDLSLYNPEEWILQLDYASKGAETNTEKKLQYQTSLVIKLLINALPDVMDIKIANEELRNDVRKRLQFKTPFGWLYLEQMSLGYRTMIAWIADLARRMFEFYPDSSDPLSEPAVVLVDEIDLHMHPRWQRDIMSFLSERFPNTQFIVTAHSPLVVQAAPDLMKEGKEVNIAVLRREGDHVVIDNNPESIWGWRIDQILASDLYGNLDPYPDNLMKLIEERRQILGKGKLTVKDKKRLQEIEDRLPYMPTAESKQDREAMKLIHEIAEDLQDYGKPKS